MIRRFLLALALLAPVFAGALLFPAHPVHAQLNAGLNAIGQTITLPSTDPRIIVARLINVALGFIGIIMLVLVIYAGFLWMTSGGDAKKIDQAKNIIRNAIIGLIIILMSYAITTYVISAILNAVQGGGGVNTQQGGGNPGGGGFGGGASNAFRVNAITPKGSVPIRNVVVKVVFTRPPDATTIQKMTVTDASGANVAGTITVAGSVALFTPSAPCPAPNGTKFCFGENTAYTVTVPKTVTSAQGDTIACSTFSPCTGSFSTGALVDTQAPDVSVGFPTPGMSVPNESLQTVKAHATDDSGVAVVSFYYDQATGIDTSAPSGNTPLSYDASVDWDTAGVSLGTHTLYATADDIDSNHSTSSQVLVDVRPAHCFNNATDTADGETGPDCGGDPAKLGLNYCGACAGDSCSSNTDCSTGVCQIPSGQVTGVCVSQPIISDVTPLTGGPGTFVTISGVNFGTTGTVTFLGDPNDPSDDVVASAPAQCAQVGLVPWSNSQVIVAVPKGAKSGPIRLLNGVSNLAADTTGKNGPKISDFTVDNSQHPGLCGLNPSSGTVGTSVKAVGQGFGTSAALINFGKESVDAFSKWTDGEVDFKVPAANSGANTVVVHTSAGDSNPSTFQVLETTLATPPQLLSIDPAQGPQGQYLTLTGAHFGFATGKVVFTDTALGFQAIGDINFPSLCSSLFWKDTTIVVKVPTTFSGSQQNQPIALGDYTVSVVRPDGAQSNTEPFTITNGNPSPGICAIEPSLGPEKTTVTVIGEHFGTQEPQVLFSNAQGVPAVAASVASGYTQSQVKTTVPTGAVTGPMQLKTTPDGQLSNKVTFTVGNCNSNPGVCGPPDKFVCCPTGECRAAGSGACSAPIPTAQYAWQTSTGIIPVAPYVIEECRPDIQPAPTPSPSPWLGRAGGDQAPTNAAILMRFSRPLDPTTVIGSNFELYKCTGDASSTDVCSKKTAVTYDGVELIHENTEQDVVKLDHTTNLDTSSTYLVDVNANVASSGKGGARMQAVTSCGTGANNQTYGYCYRFKTRGTNDPATIGAVEVKPNPFYMPTKPDPTTYLANPIDGQDACIAVECKLYNWSWYTGGSVQSQDGRATVTTDPNKKNLAWQDCTQVVSGVAETGPNNPVNVHADLAPGQGQSVGGEGDLYIQFQPPTVKSYFPNCDAACINAEIGAVFSEPMDTAFSVSQVEVKECPNENCNAQDLLSVKPIALSSTSGFDPADPTKLIIIPASNLDAAAYYHVLLKAGSSHPDGFKSADEVPLIGLNDPDGYAWTFRAKQEPQALCVADHVTLEPAQKFESRAGDATLFNATPIGAPDSCNVNGQALVPNGASWSVKDDKVAYLYDQGQVSTGGTLPQGCSSACLDTGSVTTVKNQNAVCGNGVIETTDKNYCVGGVTPAGDPCKLLPAGATGGEECEPNVGALGNVCDPNTCLIYRDQAHASSTCGDGNVDVKNGEQCDFGPHCYGGKTIADGTSCLSAADKDACTNDSGTCEMADYRGCSATCHHEGAAAGQSVCGNNDPKGDGKDCDDGNSASGDGCSAQCLHEGSKPSSQVYAVCGNGKLEPGEVCECNLKPDGTCQTDAAGHPIFPPGCDTTTCLHTGSAPCTTAGQQFCCGDADKTEPGKDCDNGAGKNGPGTGCSLTCLDEGASAGYVDSLGNPAPSFCGNGKLETGEQCEAPAAGPNVDAKQLAVVTGQGTPDAQDRISTTISATLESKTGEATYGLQCGHTSEADCPSKNGVNYGLDTNGCCRERPAVNEKYPMPAATGVCRNVLITAFFNEPMNPSSVVNNFEVDEYVQGDTCPAGTSEVSLLPGGKVPGGILNQLAFAWRTAMSWLFGWPAHASSGFVWCTGEVSGKLTPASTDASVSGFTYTLDKALDPNAQYAVRFMGDPDLTDNNDPTKRVGVKSSDGVVQQLELLDNPADNQNGSLVWTFQTGPQLCLVNNVQVSDITSPSDGHPYLFTNPNNQPETRKFEATAESIQNNQPVPLSPVDVYGWTWDTWSTSLDPTSLAVTADNGKGTTAGTSEADFTSGDRNGTGLLTVGLNVTKDNVNSVSTSGTRLEGAAPVSVLICQNPWPTLATSPFRDLPGSPSTADIQNAAAFSNGPGKKVDPFQGKYYNWSMMYCRDAGDPKLLTDDLPAMNISLVPLSAEDTAAGVLRDVLLSYPSTSPALQKDGIGIKIYTNSGHLPIGAWYKAQGFTGSPKPTTIDGYPALDDGTTAYVNATNVDPATKSIYTNVWVISHNPDAQDTTLNIFRQLVAYLTFNLNLTQMSGTCYDNTAAKTFTLKDVNGGNPIRCSTDWDCLQYGEPQVSCESDQQKLQRDMQRLADYQSLASALEDARAGSGSYPTLTSGSFIPGLATSRWLSWSSGLGTSITGNAPIDPINRLIAAGRCAKNSSTPCMTDSDCPKNDACRGGSIVNGAWAFNDGIDPSTGWDASSTTYTCPSLGGYPFDASHVYQYQAANAGTAYTLSSNFEFTGGNWQPPLTADDSACQNPGMQGVPCQSDADCKPSGSPTVTPGSCKHQGGTFVYSGVCTNQPVGQKGVCGDGVLNPGETCEIGQVRQASCNTNGLIGTQQQVCNSTCSGWIPDPASPTCNQVEVCGNGKIDKVCQTNGLVHLESGTPCTSDADCVNVASGALHYPSCLPALIPGKNVAEVCDDGSLNGTYGHCNLTCTGFDKFCGNGKIDPGEVCDNGAPGTNAQGQATGNGAYGGSCNLTCDGPGPYCGDSVVNGAEQCDNSAPQTSQNGYCNYPGKLPNVNSLTCATDADCPSQIQSGKVVKGTCVNSCVGLTVTGSDGVVRQEQHVRTCNAPQTAKACTWSGWSACQPVGVCGDGVIDPGEQCDDGTGNGWDKACLPTCKKNVCGDGYVNGGVEECDNGAQNGQNTCTAPYGSTCQACSNDCKSVAVQGGYCGDGAKQTGEECDGNTTVNSPKNTCTSGSQSALKNLCTQIAATCLNPPCQQTQETGVTCQSLGYDFSTDGLHPQIVGPSSPPPGYDTTYQQYGLSTDGMKCPGLSNVPWYEYEMFKECAGLTCVSPVSINNNTQTVLNWTPSSGLGLAPDQVKLASKADKDLALLGTVITTPHWAWNSSLDSTSFWQCVQQKGIAQGISVQTDQTATANVPSCSGTCTFANCGRCSDSAGTGVIQGYVYDALYQQVVPNARVTLTSKGVKVGETYSDQNGYFTFNILNTQPECNQYRIVVDMYQDNPCTGSNHQGNNCRAPLTVAWPSGLNVDESQNGGYFSYSSPVFSVTTFDSQFGATPVEPAHINIFPRPPKGEGYVAITWNPVKNPNYGKTTGGTYLSNYQNGTDWNAYTPILRHIHVVTPQGFTVPDPNDSQEAVNTCSPHGSAQSVSLTTCPQGGTPPCSHDTVCTQDVTWADTGRWDVSQAPYAHEICIHRVGDRSAGANNGVASLSGTTPTTNGCPIEGTVNCVNDCVAQKTKGGESQSQAQGECSTFCQADDTACSKDPNYQDCFSPQQGPIVGNFGYQPFKTPVKLYYTGEFDSVASFTADITKNMGYVAYVALSDKLTEVDPPTSGSGYSWYIGDVDPVSSKFVPQDVLQGTINANDAAVGRPDADKAMACYQYEFQCNNASYCMQNGQAVKWATSASDCPAGTTFSNDPNVSNQLNW